MDREKLRARLNSGMSLAAIGREVGLDGSTVSYWVDKHGLQLCETARHAPRGAVSEDVLRAHVERGLTTRQIAEAVGRSQSTVRYWLRRHGLSTQQRPRRAGSKPVVEGDCKRHGRTPMTRKGGTLVCHRCRTEAVSEWRRRTKMRLVAEAGGACSECGYDRCMRALQFHHVDPQTKRFAIAHLGVTRSIERLRDEAAKCVLLCSNCHAEVEAGLRELS